MKLKYFLRGLGVGILFSALVLALSFYNKPKENLTEAMIIERAKNMGMMTEQEWKDSQMEDALKNMGDQEATGEALAGGDPGEKEGNEDSASSSEPSATKKPSTQKPSASPSGSASPDTLAPPKESATPKPSSSPKASKKPKDPSDGYLAEIVVETGMVSSQVAEDLERQGIVKDAYDFDQYMCDNGFAPQIQGGTFYIPKGSSYLEIAEILMRK